MQIFNRAVIVLALMCSLNTEVKFLVTKFLFAKARIKAQSMFGCWVKIKTELYSRQMKKNCINKLKKLQRQHVKF